MAMINLKIIKNEDVLMVPKLKLLVKSLVLMLNMVEHFIHFLKVILDFSLKLLVHLRSGNLFTTDVLLLNGLTKEKKLIII